MICSCGTVFHRIHQERNVCSCGAVYDGNMTLIGGKSVTVENNKPKGIPVRNLVFSNYNKPGSALESLIPDWVVQFKDGCGCKDYSKKMDKWGTEGCIARENEIIGHLMQQSDKLIPVFRGLPQSLRKAAAKKLLAKAIEMSKKT